MKQTMTILLDNSKLAMGSFAGKQLRPYKTWLSSNNWETKEKNKMIKAKKAARLR